MAANLQDLRNEQEKMRTELLEIYKSNDKSLFALSKEMNIPYTCFRGYLIGKNLSYKSLLKIKEWLMEQLKT